MAVTMAAWVWLLLPALVMVFALGMERVEAWMPRSSMPANQPEDVVPAG